MIKDLKVVEVKQYEDGSATAMVEPTPEFIEWFCKEYKLEKFSEVDFQFWFAQNLANYLAKKQDEDSQIKD